MIGPSLPTRSSDEVQNVEEMERSTPAKEKRVIGPTIPSQVIQTNAEDQNEGMSAAAKAFLERQERIEKANEVQSNKSVNVNGSSGRDEWMLAPPSASSIGDLFQNDPSAALKARGFSQSSSMRVQKNPSNFPTATDDDNGLDSTWTETPEQRERRLYEEQMGIRSTSSNNAGEKSQHEREREERIRRAVEQHNETRGPSLLEQHQAKRRKEMRDKDRRKDDGGDRSDRRHRRDNDRDLSDAEASDSKRRSDRHKSRRHRDPSPSDSDSSQYKSRSHRRSEGHRHRSKHEEERSDRHRSSRHHSRRDESPSRHRHRSRSPSSREHASERDGKERREEKERRREKERKKRRREEEERGEKKGAPTMIWDRDAALSVGGSLMDERKRMEFIKSSSSLADRFGQGSAKYM